MSILARNQRISVKPFATVPALLDLPEIGRERDIMSLSHVSSRHGSVRHGVDLEEGCLITKSVKYTHQLAHWVDAVCLGDPGEIVS